MKALARSSHIQQKLNRYAASSYLQYRLIRLRQSVLGRLLPALNRLRRKRYAHILPLGINCEIAFWINDIWGFVESSLFAWASSRHLERMTRVLGDLDSIMRDQSSFSEISYMWKCENTGLFFHGKIPHTPGLPPPTQTELDADLSDVRGRVAHLRDKFRKYVTDEESTLFVHRISAYDVETPGLKERLDALEASISALGAKNWKLLVVCEKKVLHLMPKGANRIFRTVRRFNPTSCVPDKDKGDAAGWKAIFSEFAPARILAKNHAFKFENA